MRYISINAHTIRANTINGTDDPPIRIARSKNDKKPTYAREIEIKGDSKLIYDPQRRVMSCGARLVLVAENVEIVR